MANITIVSCNKAPIYIAYLASIALEGSVGHNRLTGLRQGSLLLQAPSIL